MKKLWKTIILSFCISCICCLCFGMTAAAKTYSGKMPDGFSWTMDLDTGTLTINGNDYFYDKNRFYETHLCWAPYQNQIRHIVLGKNVTWPGLVTELDKGELLSFPNLPNLESFSGSMKDGFSWCFSKPDATLTFTGKGPLYADNIISVNRNWQSLGNYINTLVISDGITSYGLNRKGDEASHGFYQNYDVVKVGKDFEDYFGLLDNACAATRYEVSADNPYFATYDGALYTKNYKTLLLVPTKQETVTLHSKTEALAGSDRGMGYYIYPTVQKEYRVTEGNTHFAVYDGALYTKDYQKLICCPISKTSIQFHPNVRILGAGSLRHCSWNPLVIPWGVTTLEDFSINMYSDVATLIIPDTVRSVKEHSFGLGGHEDFSLCIFSVNSPIADTLKELGLRACEYASIDVRKNLDEFYPPSVIEIQWKKIGGKYYAYDPNGQLASGWRQYKKGWYYLDPQTGIMYTGLHYINGKAYVFKNSGAREHDKWIQVNGKWYYLNSYGAGIVKYWKQSGNKWYFLQADGTMATSKWIKWYDKWYYVGKDGAMYANRYTPDGYWVDSSGVWVK